MPFQNKNKTNALQQWIERLNCRDTVCRNFYRSVSFSALECRTSNRSDVHFPSILLCFVINSLFQHLHMSAPTAQIKTNNQQIVWNKTANVRDRSMKRHSVIFGISSKTRIIILFFFSSDEKFSCEKSTWKESQGNEIHRAHVHCTQAIGWVWKNNNIYTHWLSFIQRQRQTCVFFSFFETYKSTLNTLTDGAECKVNVFYWQSNKIFSERTGEQEWEMEKETTHQSESVRRRQRKKLYLLSAHNISFLCAAFTALI